MEGSQEYMFGPFSGRENLDIGGETVRCQSAQNQDSIRVDRSHFGFERAASWSEVLRSGITFVLVLIFWAVNPWCFWTHMVGKYAQAS